MVNFIIYMKNWIKKLFKINNTQEPQTKVVLDISEWIELAKEKPPHEVVLAACETYDCGWTMHTVWWYEKKQCWMTTGDVQSVESYLPYTHWRKLPPYPFEKLDKHCICQFDLYGGNIDPKCLIHGNK